MPFLPFRRLWTRTSATSTRTLLANIDAYEQAMMALSDAELAETTPRLRAALHEGKTLDALLPEAFAAVREAGRRHLGMRAYTVQLYAGIQIHRGNVAEMKTGEGKTLMAAFPAYLNALSGKGVHIITVNEYLAKRDRDTMARLFGALGATTGLVSSSQNEHEKKEAYACDITYGTNHEIGFDFLRDGLKSALPDLVQRGLHFAIIDEIDSILIDEARTPLIISGPGEAPGAVCAAMATIVSQAQPEHWKLDEKNRSAIWTEAGDEFLEHHAHTTGLLPPQTALYDPESGPLIHRANQALRARLLFQRDRQYVVHNDKVLLVDEATGRVMSGRRLSEGLHQAIEAKEGVAIERETVTLASISLQNLFRGYTKIAGMTGTAGTEAEEFEEIYKLNVVAIPTHKPLVRQDEPDRVYRNAQGKWKAIVEEIARAHTKGQPVLAGTASVERSEHLSTLLTKAKIPHRVLNARHHAQEAGIIAEAGRWGAVTIATNMAGRGTDIQLGGSVDTLVHAARETLFDRYSQGLDSELIIDEAALRKDAEATTADERERVLQAGGLLVVGTERHESRRVDNQLRGRAGRQGDPGRSVFFVALDDDLMRVFGGDRLAATMGKMGMDEHEAIIHPLVSKSIASAQKRVEGRNFDARKNVLKYDDIANDQRKIAQRTRAGYMEGTRALETLTTLQDVTISELVDAHVPSHAYPEDWDIDALGRDLARLGLSAPLEEWRREDNVDADTIAERIVALADARMEALEQHVGAHALSAIARHALLQGFDRNWRDHVMQMDFLKTAVGFQGYAQRDPIHEYRTQAYTLFEEAIRSARRDAVRIFGDVRIELNAPNPAQMTIFGAQPAEHTTYV